MHARAANAGQRPQVPVAAPQRRAAARLHTSRPACPARTTHAPLAWQPPRIVRACATAPLPAPATPPQPQPHAPAVGPLLQFRDPRLEEQYWSQQLARRIRLMTHWAPHSDPALCAALLALHASLLLRLALGGAPGLERWPLPLAGAGLAWMQLRMGRRWVSAAPALRPAACRHRGCNSPIMVPQRRDLLSHDRLTCPPWCSRWDGCACAAGCWREPSCCWPRQWRHQRAA